MGHEVGIYELFLSTTQSQKHEHSVAQALVRDLIWRTPTDVENLGHPSHHLAQ